MTTTPSYRARWDAESNPKGQKRYPIDTTEQINVGDLMWWDRRGGVARSFASTSAWTGTTDGTRARVAESFIGYALSAHPLPDDPKRTDMQQVSIGGRGCVAYVMTTAAALHVGDLIVPSKDPAGNLLFAQQVDKGALGADPDDPTSLARELCIGKVTKEETSANNAIAEFEIIGTREAGGGPRTYLTS